MLLNKPLILQYMRMCGAITQNDLNGLKKEEKSRILRPAIDENMQ